MYHIAYNFKKVLFCSHCVFLCFVQYNSNLLVFTTEIKVFLMRSIKTGLQYIVNTNFRLQGSCNDPGGLLSVSLRGCSCLFLGWPVWDL